MSDIRIETDEDGFWLVLRPETDEEEVYGLRVKIEDPEALYDHVKAAIGPWLRERDEAKQEFDRMKRANDTRLLSDEDFSAYLDDAYGDDWGKRVSMEQMRERGIA